jgi:uroporphyrin-III C-methyltransferase/precorrin-2 dehydrogenase/sirohydrochlorin ferrochelatase
MDSLPIFLDLKGRHVVMIGEGEAAMAKARLVEAAGGRIVGEADAHGAALAFVALEDDAEAEAAAARLRAKGLLVNVVDEPKLSDFLMGAIIDRAPVTVAISTGGASASLSRALRARLEALLPHSLGGLARAIRAARRMAAGAHPTPADRRRLWDQLLAQGAVLDPLALHADPEAAVKNAVTGLAVPGTTRQVHVEVGSADPGELSANVLAAMSAADTLVVLGPVPAAVVDRARRDATRLRSLPETWPAGLTVVLQASSSLSQ